MTQLKLFTASNASAAPRQKRDSQPQTTPTDAALASSSFQSFFNTARQERQFLQGAPPTAAKAAANRPSRPREDSTAADPSLSTTANPPSTTQADPLASGNANSTTAASDTHDAPPRQAQEDTDHSSGTDPTLSGANPPGPPPGTPAGIPAGLVPSNGSVPSVAPESKASASPTVGSDAALPGAAIPAAAGQTPAPPTTTQLDPHATETATAALPPVDPQVSDPPLAARHLAKHGAPKITTPNVATQTPTAPNAVPMTANPESSQPMAAITAASTLAASPEKPPTGVSNGPNHGPAAKSSANANNLAANTSVSSDSASTPGQVATDIPPAAGLPQIDSAASSGEHAAPAKTISSGSAQAVAGSPSVLTSTTPTTQLTPGGATSAENARAAQDPPPVDRQQLLDQVMSGLRTKIDARNGQADIRLDPPNLGTLRVRIQLDNGIVSAQFYSDHSVVRGLLSENMDKLRSVLQSQGIAVDRLVVPAPANNAGVPASNLANSTGGDGRSAGHQGYSGRQSPDGQKSERGDFATVWQQAQQAPLDLVA